MKNDFLDNRIELIKDYQYFINFFFAHTKNKTIIPANHHQRVIDSISKLVWGKAEKRNLLINIAPRSGKTMMAVVFLIAYLSALSNGTCNVMLCSYSTKIAKNALREVIDIVTSPLYKKYYLNSNLDSFSDGVIKFVGGGNVYPVSPQSSLTGLGAGQRDASNGTGGLIIVDDILNSADALSPTMRSNANDWFYESLMSRKNNPKTPVLCISQRLHEEDLPGFILEKEPENWETIIIPTINDQGDSFWPEMYTVDAMQTMKEVNPFTYWTQYQQTPVPKGQGIIRENMIYFYEEHDIDLKKLIVFISADTAMKTDEVHDYSVFQVWGRFGNQKNGTLYLIDQLRGKYDAPTLLEKAKMLVDQYKPHKFLIEDKASGTGLIQQLAGYYGKYKIIAKQRGAKETKTMRMHDSAVFFNQKRVLLPKNKIWINDFVNEILSFTELMTHKHDDQCDAMSDAIWFAFIDPELKLAAF